MMPPSKRRGHSCCIAWIYLLSLGCSAPELGYTLFSCTTDADCAPGQVCLQHQDGLACQRPLPSESSCPDGLCSEPATGSAPRQPKTPDAAASADGVCREGDCSPSGISLSPAPSEPPPLPPVLTDAGASGLAGSPVATPDAGPPAPAAESPDEPDAAAPEAEGPPIRRDFEETLEGWQSVADQLPEDTLDGTEQTAERAHHGRGALRMVFDGNYTPVAGISAENSFYGAYEQDDAPPPGVEVSLWMLSTAPGVSVEVFSQPDPPAADTTLATVPLLQDEWREIRVIMPLLEARVLGVLVRSELDLEGFVYLDEIRW